MEGKKIFRNIISFISSVQKHSSFVLRFCPSLSNVFQSKKCYVLISQICMYSMPYESFHGRIKENKVIHLQIVIVRFEN